MRMTKCPQVLSLKRQGTKGAVTQTIANQKDLAKLFGDGNLRDTGSPRVCQSQYIYCISKHLPMDRGVVFRNVICCTRTFMQPQHIVAAITAQVLFRSVNKLLMDTATSEYLFCAEFFGEDTVFQQLFAPTLAVVETELSATVQVPPQCL